jgi:hypothetical protein
MSVDLTVAQNLNTNTQFIQDQHENKSALALGTDRIGIGTAKSEAKLQVINQSQDAGGNTLILGPTNASNLRLGYHTDYSWVQSHGNKPLAINSFGNNVGIGTANPSTTLDVNGTVKAKGLQVEALVLPKNPSPSGSAPNVPNPQRGQIFWDESSIWVYTGQWEKAHLGTL